MNFLVPAFLAGLAALAIPVLVHLRHRQRKTTVPFPSLMFLRKIQFREVRRQQIHHWPLFLLRALAVVLLVVAFARPFLDDPDAGAALVVRSGRDVVLVVDQSASMAAGSRMERARAAVREVVDGLGAGDRAALVLFDATASVVVPPTADRAQLLAAIGAAEPTARATRYGPALRAAREVAFGADRPGREVVLISDFHRTGWVGEDLQALPEGTGFRVVDLSGVVPDVLVATVEVVPGTEAGEGVATATARLAAAGLAAPRRITAILEVAGRQVDRQTVEVPPAGGAAVRFTPFRLAATAQEAVVRLETADSVPANDRHHFLAVAERPVRVLLRSAISDPARSFLRQALAISRHPRVEMAVRGNLAAADLTQADVVVLDNLSYPAGAEGDRLAAFVRGGGGLIHVLGERTTGGWPRDLVAARVGEVVDRSAGVPATIGLIRREHPVFEPFRLPRSGDFSATRVYRYRAVAGDSLDVLARFDDGAPALLEARPGQGRVLVLTSAADNVWNDLPIQPVFLPLAHQMVLHAGRWVDRPTAVRVGEVATVSPETLGDEAIVVVSPGGERVRRESGQALAFEATESGFYQVREAGSGGRLLASVAANTPADEFNLTPFDPADLALAAGAPDSVPAAGDATAAGLTGADREQAQSLWWYVLAAVALLLLAETMVATRVTGVIRVLESPGGTA